MDLRPLSRWLPHRDRDVSPTLLVLHATAGATAKSSIDHLRGVGLSYHYIIARDGRDSASFARVDGTEPIVFHCAPDAGHAFHVGSTIPAPSGQGGINKTSIGISLANRQRRSPREPYPQRQLATLEELIDFVKTRNPSLRWLTTHAVVQPWNRSDPLDVDGSAVAGRHGLTWWKPTAEQIAAHKP